MKKTLIYTVCYFLFCGLLTLSAQSKSTKQPIRPDHFEPFIFPLSQELREKYSDTIMMKAALEMARIEEINGKSGNFKATWASLDGHEVPEWYKDAKFGMFVDWGLYSIPAYAPTGYPDWYLWRMNTDTKEYHDKYWGKDFKADDFIPLFTAKDFDAEELTSIAVEAGMKYVVPFFKHHDGFSLWDSSYTLRNSVVMGPKRDIAQEWVEASKKHNLKLGFYYSIDDWIYPTIGSDNELRIREWHAIDGSDYKVGPYDKEEWERRQIAGKIPVKDFFNDYINPAAVEFIDKYDPDLLWFDGDWIFDAEERNTRELVAYFYNKAKGRKKVAVIDGYGNSRLVPTRGQGLDHPVHGDFNRSEGLYEPGKIRNIQNNPLAFGVKRLSGTVKTEEIAASDNVWEECHGLSHSFGYNWEETSNDVRSSDELLTMLIEIVAGGGNLLLITNLTGTGKLDPLLAERLKVVGDWLKVNDESIYGTRKWKYFAENDLRFTQSKDQKYVYAIALEWPGKKLISKVLKPKNNSSIKLLGYDESLEWEFIDNNLEIYLSTTLQDENKRTGKNAWVFKIEVD